MINTFKNIYFYTIVTIATVLTFHVANAQDESSDVYLRIYGTLVNNDNNSNLEGCVVRVLKNEQFLEKYQTKASGKYEFFLPAGSIYRFYYEKDGFVSKNIEIDCIDAANMDDQFIFSLKADISLFTAIDGMNYDILKQPIGKGVCNGRKGKVQFDKEYTSNMEEQIALLYVPVQANTSEVNRVTLSEAITEVPEEDDEITVSEIFEEAEKENEQFAIEESDTDNLKMIEEEPVVVDEIIIPEIIIEESNAKDAEEIKEVVVADVEVMENIVIEEKKRIEPEIKEVIKEPVVVAAVENRNPIIESGVSNGITWRVQIGAFTNKNVNAFQGLSDIDFITGSDGITRCVAGYHETPVSAAKHKIELINKGYSDAFITAFKGNKRISLKETGINLDHISYTKLKEEMNE